MYVNSQELHQAGEKLQVGRDGGNDVLAWRHLGRSEEPA